MSSYLLQMFWGTQEAAGVIGKAAGQSEFLAEYGGYSGGWCAGSR